MHFLVVKTGGQKFRCVSCEGLDPMKMSDIPGWWASELTSSTGAHDWDALADEALNEARAMASGTERNAALKKAGQLRVAADMKNMFAKRRTCTK